MGLDAQLWDTVLLLVPFMMVLALGKPAIAWCRKQGLVAAPDDRRVHKESTPHGGGAALVLVGVPLGLLAVWMFQLPYGWFLTVLLLASIPVAVVGYYDDRHELSAKVRLPVHLLAVAAGLAFLPPMFDFMPLWLDKLILLLAWGWFVNLYNFMDGADGLASSEAAFLACAVALLVPAFKPVALVLAGVSLGFLAFNWQPAKVFLGDVGSTWLGYVLGGLLLVACADDTMRMAWPLFACTLPFAMDATLTLLRRIGQGHHPMTPHRTFWFHRVLGLGYSHSQLAWRLAGLNMVLLVLAGLGLATGLEVFVLPAGVALVAFLMYAVGQRERTIYGKPQI
jgi:UDP-N-acetylmuramyl pentapeptide phosphotransferase/UDP-N-acetylglucosamine-1-phosphate transferase